MFTSYLQGTTWKERCVACVHVGRSTRGVPQKKVRKVGRRKRRAGKLGEGGRKERVAGGVKKGERKSKGGGRKLEDRGGVDSD